MISFNKLLDSICELSQHCKEFASMVAGPIVDMFNDEINHVRINAIHSLRKMSDVGYFLLICSLV